MGTSQEGGGEASGHLPGSGNLQEERILGWCRGTSDVDFFLFSPESRRLTLEGSGTIGTRSTFQLAGETRVQSFLGTPPLPCMDT